MAERKRLVIIDGKSVFYRGYYAMPNLSTKDGTPTGGVYGFAVMALEVIKRLKPDYVCVAWDKPKTNIRSRLALYPEYKAGRKPAPPDFYTQIPILHELLQAFGWPLYELDDYEADDIMGALAEQAKKQDINTFLITSDLDVLQLVNSHTHAYTLKTGLSNIVEFDEEAFKAKYGIDVHQFIDLKALKGDSSDNIPGVPGIGEKGALELLHQYKTLDGIYENLALLKDSMRKKLEAGRESAYLSKKLVTLMLDAPIKLDLEAMDISKLDARELGEILQRLEFRNLIRQLPDVMRYVPDEAADGGAAARPDAALRLGEITAIETDAALTKLTLPATKHVVLHSVSLRPHGVDPQQLVLSPDADTVISFDLTKLDAAKVRAKLKPWLEPLGLVGYDVKNTIQTLKTLGIDARNVEHDVLVGAFLIDALRREQTLVELAGADIGFNLTPGSTVAEITAVIRALYKQQKDQLKDLPKVAKLAEDIEWPIIPVLADMEYEGIQLDVPTLNRMSEAFDDIISDLTQQIYGFADQEFNIGSPSQLAKVLYEDLGLDSKNVKKGKTGALSTAAVELEKLRFVHPIIELIMQYREVTKLKSTYVDTLPKLVDSGSRVHTTFALTVAQTGRLSSNDPNLQNIPVRSEAGKKIREAFVAGKGKLLVSADYSQFELRLAAALSGDEGMIEAFNQDHDIHQLTSASVLGIKPEDVTKQQRYQAKAVNFGIMYGQGPHGLAVQTGMTFAEARDFIAKYFEIRPKLKQYIDSLRKKAQEDGYVETLFGRRRPMPDIHSTNFVVRAAAERAAINMPLQGTAADLTKLAMIRVNAKLGGLGGDCKMLLQIHDSILIECPEGDAEAVGELLKETMENVHKLPVKLKVDVSSGTNWGDL